MANCYLCNEVLTTENDHGEHIFQQALGGTLIKTGILCKNCGNRLGQEIDVPFVDIFKNYISRLPINFDRKSKNKNFTEKGSIFIPEFNLTFKFRINKKDFLPIGVDAFMNGSNLIVLYPKGMPEKNLDGLKKDKMRYFGVENPESVIVIRDFNSYSENIYAIPFNLDNKAYKQGMAKIAIGFAISNNIKREGLECVLDIDNHQIKQKIPLLPYMPWDFINSAIEELRFSSDDLRYLSHQIKLFNLENRLFCYIEIFGTFQCYILLSENYNSKNINKSYMQPIFQIKRDELEYLPHPKDLLLYRHLLPEDEKPDYSEKTLTKINEAIRKQTNELDLNEYYSNLLNIASMNFHLFLESSCREYIECKELILFFENNIKEINNPDKKYEILKRLHFFTSYPQAIRTECYWEMLYRFHLRYGEKVYEYNSRKMKKLESMIKQIQDNKMQFQIWNMNY